MKENSPSALSDSASKKKTVFCSLIVISLIYSILLAFFGHGEASRWIFFWDQRDSFMDFYNCLYDSCFENPYLDRGVIYPPLTYVIYRFFGQMIPDLKFLYWNMDLRSFQPAVLSFSLYFAASFVLFSYSLWLFLKKYDRQWIPLLICILVSAPVVFAFERGNLIFLAISGILVFLSLYESESFLEREFGLIALAFAANIKLYPAVFGLLLLNREHWKDALRCVVYGVLLFVLPMFVFGGLSNIPVLVVNILNTSDGFEDIYENRVDIGNVFRYFSDCNIHSGFFSRLSVLTLPLGTALLSLAGFLVREKWKKVLAFCIICAALPGFSWSYNLMYYIPALLLCIYESRNSRRNLVYFFLLLLFFLYYPFSASTIFPSSFIPFFPSRRAWDTLATGSHFLLILMLVCDGIYERILDPQEKILFLTDQLPRQSGNGSCGKICFLTSGSMKKGAVNYE